MWATTASAAPTPIARTETTATPATAPLAPGRTVGWSAVTAMTRTTTSVISSKVRMKATSKAGA